MQKSVFAKYFTMCILIIIASIVFLGTIIFTFDMQYLRRKQYESLELSINQITQSVKFYKSDPNTKISYQKEEFYKTATILSNTAEATFFICDIDGKIIACNEASSLKHKSKLVSSRIMNNLFKSDVYKEDGNLDGMFDEKCYTVAVEIEKDGITLGYLFASSYPKLITQFMNEVFNIFFVSSVAILIVSFIIIFILTSHLVNPIKDMCAITKKYGRGEFNVRMNIGREDEIGELAKALNKMADDLSILESSRRSFTANVSHELKTPMTTISGFIDGILDGTIPKKEHKRYLHIVSDEVKRLSRLVKTMLNLSKIEAGEMDIKTSSFNIIDTVVRTVFSFENAIENKKIEIIGLDHEPLMVDADENLIHQVIYNLMDNAVKFVDIGGTIQFDFAKSLGKATIKIKNSGPGLSKEDLDKIFDRFYKTDKSRGKDKNGVGLGLYIVKTIINLHDGEIIVKSVQNEYTEFAFSLNCSARPKKSAPKVGPR